MSDGRLKGDRVVVDCELIANAQQYLDAKLQGADADTLLAEAWSDFYRIYSASIRRLAYACHVSVGDLDDCMQDVWLAVILELPSFQLREDGRGFRSWLYKLVRSKAVDRLRKAARRRTRAVSQLRAMEIEAPAEDPAARSERELTRRLVRAVVAEMRKSCGDDNYRIFLMRRLEERSVADVSAKLHMSRDQIYVRLHRTQKRFRRIWKFYKNRQSRDQ